MVKTGCTFGIINRERIEVLDKKMEGVDKKLDKIIDGNKEMFNHFTERYESMFEQLRSRVPIWVSVLFTIGGIMLSAMLTYILTGMGGV